MKLTRRGLFLGLAAAPAIAAAALKPRERTSAIVDARCGRLGNIPPVDHLAVLSFDPCRLGYKLKVIQGGGPGQFLVVTRSGKVQCKFALWPTGEACIPAELVEPETTFHLAFEGAFVDVQATAHYSDL